jgi:hypothetical protein
VSDFAKGARVYTQSEWDALVAERDEARRDNEGLWNDADAAIARAEAAEADRDRYAEILHDVWRSYQLIDADQAHLDHSMESVERALGFAADRSADGRAVQHG